MRTIEQIEKEITQLNKKTNRLRRDLEALKVQPEPLTGRVLDDDYKGEVFTVYTDGDIWEGKASCNYINQGREFYDLESAGRFSLFERLQKRERVAAAKAWKDEGKVLDWGDRRQCKYRAVFVHNTNRVEPFCFGLVQAPQPHFPTPESLLAFYNTLTQDEQKLLCTGVE
jgi:hypothetical protein